MFSHILRASFTYPGYVSHFLKNTFSHIKDIFSHILQDMFSYIQDMFSHILQDMFSHIQDVFTYPAGYVFTYPALHVFAYLGNDLAYPALYVFVHKQMFSHILQDIFVNIQDTFPYILQYVFAYPSHVFTPNNNTNKDLIEKITKFHALAYKISFSAFWILL